MSLAGVLGLATAACTVVVALANGRRLRASRYGREDDASPPDDDRLFHSASGNVNGQEYWPLYVAATESGVAFKAMGFRIKVPYEDIQTTVKASVFFTYVYLRSKRDPSLKIRISKTLAEKISEQSKGRFHVAA